MTFPRVVRDLLIFEPSLRRAPYMSAMLSDDAHTVAPVEACLSDPARSTRDILETFSPIMLVTGSSRF